MGSGGVFKGNTPMEIVAGLGLQAVVDHMYDGLEIHFLIYSPNANPGIRWESQMIDHYLDPKGQNSEFKAKDPDGSFHPLKRLFEVCPQARDSFYAIPEGAIAADGKCYAQAGSSSSEGDNCDLIPGQVA